MPRKQHIYHYIYKTTCKVTGRFYIGMHSTSNLEDGYIGSGKRLWNSINKHGRENHEFEILEYLPDRSSLKEREKEIVNEGLLQDPMCMNLKIGGEGGFSKDVCTKGGKIAGNLHKEKMINDVEYKEKTLKIASRTFEQCWKDGRIKAKCGKDNPFFGKHHSEKTKDKLRGKSKQKGELNSQFGTHWINNGFENKKWKKNETLPDGWIKGRKNIII